MPAEIEVHWFYVIAAMVMLFIPRQWMRFGARLFKKRRKHKDKLEQFAENKARDPDDKSVRLAAEFANKRNYIDFIRGAAGAYCLVEFSFTMTERTEDAETVILTLRLFVCLVGLLIQSVRKEQKLSFFAAIFYLVGMSIGLCGYPAALAFLLVLAINPVLPNPRMFITAHALLILPFGYIFGSPSGLMMGCFTLLVLVPVISLMAKKPMVIYAKKVKPA